MRFEFEADDYLAAGINLSFPVFTGGLLSARQREGDLHAKKASASLQTEEDNIT
jgi:outer membrane protein TolC